MLLVTAVDPSGSVVRRIGTSDMASASRWLAEWIAELGPGTVAIDEADSHARPIRRIAAAWVS